MLKKLMRLLITISVYSGCGLILLAIWINCGWDRTEKLVEKMVDMILEDK